MLNGGGGGSGEMSHKDFSSGLRGPKGLRSQGVDVRMNSSSRIAAIFHAPVDIFLHLQQVKTIPG